MESYIQPIINRDPSNIIIYCGTNDLKSSDKPEETAERIINLAKKWKMITNSVMISEITPRWDTLNQNAIYVNSILTD